MKRRRYGVWKAELGRVADNRGSQEDAAVEERRMVDGRDCQNGVTVRQALATFPLDNALVCAAYVHHLGYTNAIVTSRVLA